MKFYNRINELKYLKDLDNRGFKFVLTRGIRRIGKTRLIEEFLKDKKYVYLFIKKTDTENILLRGLSETLKIPLFTKLEDMFDHLFSKYNYIFIDEGQNLYNIKKSIFGYFQQKFDYLDHNNITKYVLMTGSSNSLIRKIFYDYEKELYGRVNGKIYLKELKSGTIYRLLTDLGFSDFEDKLKTWFVFGGIVKFYSDLSLFKPKSFNEIKQKYLMHYDEMYNEGKEIIISEMGGEHKIYFSLLDSIASGKTKFNEIKANFDNDGNKTNRYLGIVKNEFQLITIEKPIMSLLKKRDKQVLYKIKYPFLGYWFDTIYRYKSLIEQEHYNIYNKMHDLRLQNIFGFRFEEFIIDMMKKHMPNFNIGRQWGKIPRSFKPDPAKSTYEIDLLGINEKTKQIIFGEAKWKNKVDAKKIAKELNEKTQYVDWHNKDRKEKLYIFAKSFKRKIREIEGKPVECINLKDLEKWIK